MGTNKALRFQPHKLILGLALMLAMTSLTFGQMTTQVRQTPADRNIQSIPNGAKLKFKGVVIDREGEHSGSETAIALTIRC